MSQQLDRPTYRSALALPGAGYSFSIALVGRLAYGTISLPLLFTIQGATDSFRVAGLALGAFGIATLTAPLKSRLMDSKGQLLVLTVLGLLFPIPLLLLAFWGEEFARSSALIVVLATFSGLFTPPLGPAMRFLWSQMATSPELKQRAYTMDSIVEESLYTIGPAIAGGIIAVGRPDVALVLTAGLALVGTLGLSTSWASRSYGKPHGTTKIPVGVGPLKVPAFSSVLAAVVGVGVALGAVEITVAARAADAGVPGQAGYVLAGLALGSVLGGILWGRRTHHRKRSTHLVALMSLFALGTALAGWAPNLTVVGVAVFIAGLGLSPVFIVSYLASDDLVPLEQRTEATTWINTVNNLGWSGGSAFAGWMVAESDSRTTLGVGAIVVVVAAALVVVNRRAVDAI